LKPKHHPDQSTLLAYASGSITESFSLLIAAHLEWCAECRAELAKAESLGGGLLEKLPQAEMSNTALTQIWETIDSGSRIEQPTRKLPPIDGLPSVLSNLFPNGLDQVEWNRLAPGIKQHKLTNLDSGAGTTRLLQIDKGICIPDHTHLGTELTFILQGSYSDKTGQYQRGDLSDVDGSLKHSPIVDSEQPCICLIATDERLVFSSMFNRIIQPLFGM
jgi:putative transcriptional regulator